MAARRGLNCTLSYAKAGQTRAYRVRVKRLTMGFEMVSQESQARASRAFYPYQTAPSKFAITLDLVGDAERRSFNSFMMRYAEYILDPAIKGDITPQMRVEVPSRTFVRVGIPNEGIEFGARLGAMVWQPTVVFEVSQEPSDWAGEEVRYTQVAARFARLREPETKYFYPTGVQLHGDETPAVQATVFTMDNEKDHTVGGTDGPDYHDPANQLDYNQPYYPTYYGD